MTLKSFKLHKSTWHRLPHIFICASPSPLWRCAPPQARRLSLLSVVCRCKQTHKCCPHPTLGVPPCPPHRPDTQPATHTRRDSAAYKHRKRPAFCRSLIRFISYWLSGHASSSRMQRSSPRGAETDLRACWERPSAKCSVRTRAVSLAPLQEQRHSVAGSQCIHLFSERLINDFLFITITILCYFWFLIF